MLRSRFSQKTRSPGPLVVRNKEEGGRKLRWRPSPATVISIVALIVALGGTAVAGGVLNKKKVNKIITNRAPGLSVASAKNADTLGGVAASGFLPSSGSFQVQEGIDSFEAASGAASVQRFTGSVGLRSNTANQFFNAPLDVPSAVQGRPVNLNSVVFCYDVNTNATLDSVQVVKITNANGPSSTTDLVDDETDRTGSTCRTYTPASPATIGPNDSLQFVVKGAYTAAANIDVGRLTVNLST